MDFSSICLTVFQCLMIALTALSGIINLKKEFRRHQDVAIKEAKHQHFITILFAVLAISSQIVSSIIANKSSITLNKRLDTLNFKNDTLAKHNEQLQKAIISEVDSSTATVVFNASQDALRASKQIAKSADNLNELITGTDEAPSFFAVVNYKTLHAALSNVNVKPIINLRGILINYDNVMNCNVSKERKVINDSCFNSNKNTFNIPYLTTNVNYPIDLPKLDSKRNIYKFMLIVDVKNTRYAEEIYIKLNNYKVDCNVMIFKIFGEKMDTTHPYRTYGISSSKINWIKEFELLSNYGLGDTD